MIENRITVNDNMEREYAYCGACGNVVYKLHFRYQEDSAWLLAGVVDIREDHIDVDNLPMVDCGCTEH